MKNFNDIYEEIYKKSYNAIEEKRKGAQRRIVVIFVIFLVIGIMLSNTAPKNGWLMIFFSVVAAVLYIALTSRNTQYNIAYKQLVIDNFIKEYDTNLEYRHNRGISSNVYAMGEFENFDRYYAEDYIYGVLDNKINIAMSEVKTEIKRRDSKGNTYYIPIFQGLFAKVDINRIINSTTKIRKNKLKLIDSKNGLEMDSGEFEKIFDVYSDGKIDTMQILTLDTMQKIIDFNEKTKLIPEFTIKGNSVYIRFVPQVVTLNNNAMDIFEPNILKNALDYETLKLYFDIITFIDNITDEIANNIEESGIQ